MKTRRIVPIRPPAAQADRAVLPPNVLYALFLTQADETGFPTGDYWLAVLFPSLDTIRINLAGYQPVHRLVAALAAAVPAQPGDLEAILQVTHKIMSADKQNRR